MNPAIATIRATDSADRMIMNRGSVCAAVVIYILLSWWLLPWKKQFRSFCEQLPSLISSAPHSTVPHNQPPEQFFHRHPPNPIIHTSYPNTTMVHALHTPDHKFYECNLYLFQSLFPVGWRQSSWWFYLLPFFFTGYKVGWELSFLLIIDSLVTHAFLSFSSVLSLRIWFSYVYRNPSYLWGSIIINISRNKIKWQMGWSFNHGTKKIHLSVRSPQHVKQKMEIGFGFLASYEINEIRWSFHSMRGWRWYID